MCRRALHTLIHTPTHRHTCDMTHTWLRLCVVRHKAITVLAQLIVYDVLSSKLGFDNETRTHTYRQLHTHTPRAAS